ncbi:MAG TPA: DotI/IcmL/TraM family protein [Alphaproteobacteria bacterium]|nr:DotI/IcmL/TraM family protein [Alphaproteobacteria bacterium]
MADTQAKASTSIRPEAISYREGFYNLVWIVRALALGILAMTCVLLYYITSVVPQDRYAALTGIDGRTVMPMVALSTPNVTNDALMAWATQAATDVMTFGFHDLDQQFSNSRKYFTDEGWQSFSTAFAKSVFLKNLLSSQQIVTAIPRGTPTVVHIGLYKGKYQWILDVPMLMTIRAGARARQQRTVVRMFIVRMPTQNNPMGIGINTWRQD